jgi:hypothetical protein
MLPLIIIKIFFIYFFGFWLNTKHPQNEIMQVNKLEFPSYILKYVIHNLYKNILIIL